MSHYRDLNKELVEQVQAMRLNIKLYCDEIVYLKGELIQKHESQVLLRKQCYNWAVNNFVQLIQCVQPDSDILPILKEHINAEERISCTSTERRHHWRTRRSSDARRRSSILTRNFLRSSSVIQLRKSVCNTSPIRRSSIEVDEEEDQNLQTVPSDNEELANEMVADNEPTQTEISRTVRDSEIGNIFFEVFDEEEEEITNDENLDVESVNESVGEVSINISKERNALNNITNSNSRRQNAHVKDVNKSRARPNRTKKKNLSEIEFSTDDYTTAKEDSDIDKTKKRYMTRQTKLTDKSNRSIEEDTLQEHRRCSSNNFDTQKSLSLKQCNGRVSNNVTSRSTQLVLNDITLRNFKDAACSTPNSRQNSLEATTPPTQCETASTIQTSLNTSTRPSRNCKPKNLVEPSLIKKLRNVSKAKTQKK